MTPWWSKPTSDGADEKSTSKSSDAPQEPAKKRSPGPEPDKVKAVDSKKAGSKKADSALEAEKGSEKPRESKPRASRSRARKPKKTEEAAPESAPKAEEDEGRGAGREADPLASRTRRSRSSRRRSARTARSEEGSDEKKAPASLPGTAVEGQEPALAVFCEVYPAPGCLLSDLRLPVTLHVAFWDQTACESPDLKSAQWLPGTYTSPLETVQIARERREPLHNAVGKDADRRY